MSKTTLSPVIAGTMNWGVWDKNLSALEMENLIHLCLENQISTFDHADIYGVIPQKHNLAKHFYNQE